MEKVLAMLKNRERVSDLGWLILRIGIGTIFIMHGYGKLMAGAPKWLMLGNQMANFGITFAPQMWGFAAMCTELCGGALLAVGLCTRIVAVLLSFVMIIAIRMHMVNGDAFSTLAHPLSLLVVFIALLVAGSGHYSLDYYLQKTHRHK